ncbi:2-hydroxychromene-2-carboxylate isomerase [Falsiphaeobacter marinintestinus]|uniref:2-hydroxychromene-2-carboxylate isomerase n=1 Tax=Falsiphaeobacter marinintestinus TaxID=1492905 RepID=UPI0011B5B98C|nr:2-hydroxychromene-2-carboxylate isomerase [Phaeobacter marinintestinus]
MARVLEFWFEFASPYSYLSAMRIMPMAHAAGVDVVWKPFLLGPIFAAQGWSDSPFNIYPAKGRYMWRDMERRAAQLELPFQRPEPFPQNGLMAARLSLAALDHPQGHAFCQNVYSAQFAKGQDISDPGVLHQCLEATGLDAALFEQAKSDRIKQALRTQTEAAQTAGIFGAPSFVASDELFWGDDRLEDALDHAAQIPV